MKRIFTKRPMLCVSLRLPVVERELWRAAAAREGASQSEFFRKAIAERAKKVLFNDQNQVEVR